MICLSPRSCICGWKPSAVRAARNASAPVAARSSPRASLVAHLSIRCDAELLATEVSLQRLHALGERLASHVRLEERELFPLIEDSLTGTDLSTLGDRLLEALR